MRRLANVDEEGGRSSQREQHVRGGTRRRRCDGVEDRAQEERHRDGETQTGDVRVQVLRLMTGDLNQELILTRSQTILEDLLQSQIRERVIGDEEEEHRKTRRRNHIEQSGVDGEVTRRADRLRLRRTLDESRGELFVPREAQEESLRLVRVIRLLLHGTDNRVQRERRVTAQLVERLGTDTRHRLLGGDRGALT